MTSSAMPATTRRVQDMYTRFPYPPLGDMGSAVPIAANLDFARHIFWPGRSDLAGLRVLDAGCGTGTTVVSIASQHPDVQVVGIDLSATSLDRAHALAQERGVGSNLQLRVLPLEEVGTLGQQFDYIISTGVIHHLESPEAGLRALTAVLAPTGGISLMVYATYGRTGVYMLQDAIRVLGMGADYPELLALGRPLLELLPADHPFNAVRFGEVAWKDDAGIVDLLLHPRDRSYTVPQLFELLDGAGLRCSRFLDRVGYDPAIYVHAPELVQQLNRLDPPARAALAELLNGRMPRHELYATRTTYAPHQPPPSGLVLLAMRPRRSPLFRWGEVQVVGKKRHRQFRVTELEFGNGHTREFDFAPWQFAAVRECDGMRTAKDIFNLSLVQDQIPGDDSDAKLQRFGELLEVLADQEVILCEI